MEAKNMIFIISDEHAREITGCYGNTIIKTPNIDRLAKSGTRFSNAYTNCPVCKPARASLATGRFVHEIRNWDNAHPYFGETKGWGHRLLDEGHNVTAIGKLHYRSSKDSTGFSDEINTLNAKDGKGDLLGLIRDKNMVERKAAKQLAEQAGPGDSSYIRYDVNTAQEAVRWLKEEAPKHASQPWVLFIGFVLPHFPLIAPQKYFDMYPVKSLPWPRMYYKDEHVRHPAVESLSNVMGYNRHFTTEKVQVARSAYFGMISMLDYHIGQVLKAMTENGHSDTTRVIYTSDHGDNMGHRGMWGKSVMYEESVGIPMIIAGPDVPSGNVVKSPVSLVDCYQTILESSGLDLTEDEEYNMPGHSLLRIASGERLKRTIFSEYHAFGSSAAFYMIRNGHWKYTHYIGEAPELYNLATDPYEMKNLGESAIHQAIIQDCEEKLCNIVDPEFVNSQAFADQKIMIEANGGVEKILALDEIGYSPPPDTSVPIAN